MITDKTALRKQTIAGHLLLSALVVLWNLALLLRPGWRHGWLPFQMGNEALGGFWLSNLVWLVIAPSGIAWAFLKQKPWARLTTWILCGSTGYAALYILGLAISLGNGVKGAVCMLLLWIAYLILTFRASLLD